MSKVWFVTGAGRGSVLRFRHHLAVIPARLEARMDSLFSFPIGLFHRLQHAGVARRIPSGPSSKTNRLRT